MKIEKNSLGYYIRTKVSKPCPFCGQKAEIDGFEEAEPYEPSMYYAGEELSCLGCGVSFRKYFKDENDREKKLEIRKSLIAKWNKRVEAKGMTIP